MTAKTSISLTDSQEAFARGLVARGRYASVSAVLQHGLELLRSETGRKTRNWRR
jgi:antitoxin ParD1/3/4